MLTSRSCTGRGCMITLIINLDTKEGWIARFTSRTFYPRASCHHDFLSARNIRVSRTEQLFFGVAGFVVVTIPTELSRLHY